MLVLNDQGGGIMDVTFDITQTLRAQDHGHPPLVLVYESHGQDCRYRYLGDVCSTVSQKYGTGGCNVPLVVEIDEDIQRESLR